MRGYVDPSIEPRSGRERALIAEIQRMGLCLHRVHAGAIRITGPGVFITVASLGAVTLQDLDSATDADARKLLRRYG